LQDLNKVNNLVHRSLNATEAPYKNYPFGVNTTIQLKSITNWRKNDI